MNRLLLSCGLALAGLSLAAQGPAPVRYDTRAEILAEPAKANGEYYMYEFDLPDPTPAPKGYKPFYISHLGRHGARYALRDNVYEQLLDLFSQAHAAGALNPAGERLRARYEAFYPKVAHRGGELTFSGQEQHRRIAAKMLRDYPAVFKGKTHAEVISTPIHRVIQSMMAFLDELQVRDKDFGFRFDVGNIYLPWLDPMSKNTPGYIPTKPYGEAALASLSQMKADCFDAEAFARRYFSDAAWLEAQYGQWDFAQNLRLVIVDIPCLDFVPDDDFSDVFTAEELFGLWEYRNYSGYLFNGRTPLGDRKTCMETWTIVDEMIRHADEDIESGQTALRLRFSHDSALMPLLSFLCVNSFGAQVEDPHAVRDYWRCYDIPMACNLQLVFYRSRRDARILFVPLLNGREATLPFPSVSGPYYSWEDFKAYYLPRVAEARAFMASY